MASKQPRAAAFTGSVVLTDLKHCIQGSRLLESSLNSTVVGFKYRCCVGETLESTDTVSIVSRLPAFVESPG